MGAIHGKRTTVPAQLSAWQVLALLRAARLGSDTAFEDLCTDYRSLVETLAREFFLRGSDEDDVRQEAWIGFASAVRDYRTGKGASFASFVSVCVRRRLITAVKTDGRLKHRSLRDSVRVAVSDSGEEIQVVDLLPTPYSVDPCEILIRRERLERILAAIGGMTQVERDSLLDVVAGVTYADQKAARGSSYKRIDNAVQRARRKLARVEAA